MERKEMLFVVLVGLLVLTAGFQTMQLVGLTSKQVVVPSASAASAPAATGATSAPSVPTNLQNLPSMVGGC